MVNWCQRILEKLLPKNATTFELTRIFPPKSMLQSFCTQNFAQGSFEKELYTKWHVAGQHPLTSFGQRMLPCHKFSAHENVFLKINTTVTVYTKLNSELTFENLLPWQQHPLAKGCCPDTFFELAIILSERSTLQSLCIKIEQRADF